MQRAVCVLAPCRLAHIDALTTVVADGGSRLVAVGYVSGSATVLQGGVRPGVERFRVRGSYRCDLGSIAGACRRDRCDALAW